MRAPYVRASARARAWIDYAINQWAVDVCEWRYGDDVVSHRAASTSDCVARTFILLVKRQGCNFHRAAPIGRESLSRSCTAAEAARRAAYKSNPTTPRSRRRVDDFRFTSATRARAYYSARPRLRNEKRPRQNLERIVRRGPPLHSAVQSGSTLNHFVSLAWPREDYIGFVVLQFSEISPAPVPEVHRTFSLIANFRHAVCRFSDERERETAVLDSPQLDDRAETRDAHSRFRIPRDLEISRSALALRNVRQRFVWSWR